MGGEDEKDELAEVVGTAVLPEDREQRKVQKTR